MNQNISKVISEKRRSLKMTQKDLADTLYVSDKTISKWETGRGIPDISNLIPLANALDLSLEDLLIPRENDSMNKTVVESAIDYATEVQEHKTKIYTRIIDGIVYTVLLASISICMVVDLSLNGTITWAGIPGVSILFVLGVYAVMRYRKGQWYENLVVGVWIMTVPLVFVLALLTDIKWFVPIGIPMSIGGIGLTMVLYAIARSNRPNQTKMILSYAIVLLFQVVSNLYLTLIGVKDSFGSWDILSLVMVGVVGAIALLSTKLIGTYIQKSDV